jgi:hypothetical protein
MKRFALVVALMLLWGIAYAQPPVEVTADDTLEFSPGQTKVISFDRAVSQINVPGEGIVKVTPITDRTFAISALNSGRSLAIAYAPDGKEIHRLTVVVAGHMVKLYGRKPPLTKPASHPGEEYDSFICTGTGCGRVNPELPSGGPSAVIISDTQSRSEGGSSTVTKEYR